MRQLKAVCEKFLLVMVGFVIFLILLELSLRLGGGVFYFFQDQHNKQRLRGAGICRIMCIGESTTALGGENSYPSQLERVLNEAKIGVNFKVINKGLPARQTTQIVALLEDNVKQFRPDIVVAMMGVNDVCLGPDATFLVRSIGIKRVYRGLRIHKVWKMLVQRLERRYGNKNGFEQQNKTDEQEVFYMEKRDIEYLRKLYTARGYRNEGGNLSQAICSLLELVQEYPQEYWTYFELGGCYRHIGDFVKSEAMYLKALELNPYNPWIYGGLTVTYRSLGKEERALSYEEKEKELLLLQYVSQTEKNYRAMQEKLSSKKIKLVCVQYPMRPVESLKLMLGSSNENVAFVDNEKTFKEAVAKGRYEDYFSDSFGGDFGHCTPQGNRLLAENVADVILRQFFRKHVSPG